LICEHGFYEHDPLGSLGQPCPAGTGHQAPPAKGCWDLRTSLLRCFNGDQQACKCVQWPLEPYPILEGELARLFENPVVVTPVVPPPLPPLDTRRVLRERERAIEEIEARGGLSEVIPLEIQLEATYELRDALGRAIERLEQEIDRLENT
jgi:hypothetical protein